MSAPVVQAMYEYGHAMRGDWGSIDGRAVRSDIHAMADAFASPEQYADWDIARWRNYFDICPTGNGHWSDHCDDECAEADR